jgi:hypothetical protein
MKNNFKLKIVLLGIILASSFLIGGSILADNCSDKYPDDGYCAAECGPAYLSDSDLSICGSSQKCCHRFVEPPNVQLQVPIFGYTKARDLTEYIVKIYQAALYVIIPLAILVIMYAGIRWILAGGDPGRIKEAKNYITGAILGVTIAILGIFILSLVGIKSIKHLQIQPIIEEIPTDVFLKITNVNPILLNPLSDQYKALAIQDAQANGIHPCVATTILSMESAGRPNAIGHDENVRANGVSARINFLSSGRYYSGATFSASNDATSSITNDDCTINPGSCRIKTQCSDYSTLCLDWRFSHGIGLGQVTIFPNSFCSGVPSISKGGVCYTIRDLLDPQKNLDSSIRIWKANFNGSDYRTAFRKYNGSGQAAENYANKAMGIFNSCCSASGGC